MASRIRKALNNRVLGLEHIGSTAQRPWRDMNDYADAKTDVVLDMLGRARRWRAGTMAG